MYFLILRNKKILLLAILTVFYAGVKVTFLSRGLCPNNHIILFCVFLTKQRHQDVHNLHHFQPWPAMSLGPSLGQGQRWNIPLRYQRSGLVYFWRGRCTIHLLRLPFQNFTETYLPETWPWPGPGSRRSDL